MLDCRKGQQSPQLFLPPTPPVLPCISSALPSAACPPLRPPVQTNSPHLLQITSEFCPAQFCWEILVKTKIIIIIIIIIVVKERVNLLIPSQVSNVGEVWGLPAAELLASCGSRIFPMLLPHGALRWLRSSTHHIPLHLLGRRKRSIFLFKDTSQNLYALVHTIWHWPEPSRV